MAKRCVVIWFDDGDTREAMAFYRMPSGAPFCPGWLADLTAAWLDALDVLQVPEDSPCQTFNNAISISITDDSAIYDSDYSIMTHSLRTEFARAYGGTWARGDI